MSTTSLVATTQSCKLRSPSGSLEPVKPGRLGATTRWPARGELLEHGVHARVAEHPVQVAHGRTLTQLDDADMPVPIRQRARCEMTGQRCASVHWARLPTGASWWSVFGHQWSS